MEEKLKILFNECVNELKSIGLDVTDSEKYGTIDISLAKRKAKRYGCCKQENPDKRSKYRENRVTKYGIFLTHHIEISKWLMELNDDIIKNTIMHELIHCMPYCNNHGKEFKAYSKLINDKLGYDISRVGNKKDDYEKSNLEFDESIDRKYKYIIECKTCNQKFYRQRIAKNFLRKYRCGNCGSKFVITEIG